MDATDAASMEAALNEWIWTPTSEGRTGDLGDWAEGEPGPGGEFPFLPEEWISREDYLQLRKDNLPVFCHVQGRESLACYQLKNNALEKIGVQAFPG
jgi:hypothetical protein